MATAKKSPLQRVREEHKTKETLVDRLLEQLDRGEEAKDDAKARLLASSNKKLLRLLDASLELKKRFGTRQKAAESIAQLLGKAKDKDYIAKLVKQEKEIEDLEAKITDLRAGVQKKSKELSDYLLNLTLEDEKPVEPKK
jgi:hypothetical protein